MAVLNEGRPAAADRLAQVLARIEAACAAAGRRTDEITLIAVGKGIPAEQVTELLVLGVTDVGENKAQEAAAKAAEIASRRPELAARWHFIGQLQRNKAGSVAAFASMVHSVDRPALVAALDRSAARRERPLDVLLQLDLDPDPDPARGGVAPGDLAALADAVLGVEHLLLRGVMTVAPPGADARRSFDRLVEFSESLQVIAPSATVVSAGMSADLEAAISAGATHVRVGTALFGARKLASEHRT
ncbi:MAG: YggS family pyridoxal phosphate-dependent enzyme [Actinomycetota bacterium]|nr:YggS family pyridoxal phosphate-dependent enzyme [Actinomycetota bacterium]